MCFCIILNVRPCDTQKNGTIGVSQKPLIPVAQGFLSVRGHGLEERWHGLTAPFMSFILLLGLWRSEMMFEIEVETLSILAYVGGGCCCRRRHKFL